MALMAPVKDGVIQMNGTREEESVKTKKSSGNTLDKEAFLKLLVAQMQYQDPLEPTSNTEFIAQYAQFSQVESLQNMSASMDLQRASSLVGQEVYVRTDSGYVQGKVDYVSFEGGKAYVYINEEAYPLDDVETVLDPQYFEAYDKAMELVAGISKLPMLGLLDLTYGERIDELEKLYNSMNDYQKTFVAKEMVDKLNSYIEKIKELRLIAGQSGGSTGGTEESGSIGGADSRGDADGTEDTEGSGDAADGE